MAQAVKRKREEAEVLVLFADGCRITQERCGATLLSPSGEALAHEHKLIVAARPEAVGYPEAFRFFVRMLAQVREAVATVAAREEVRS